MAMGIRRTALSLANRQVILTEVSDTAFLVNEGNVDVYIVPQGGRQSGRRMQVCRVGQGDVVPAFCYQDDDHQRWVFALVAVGTVELTVMEHAATDPLRASFLTRSGLVDEVGQGFDDCLVNRYRRIQAMEHGYFVRANRDVRDTAQQTSDLLTGSSSTHDVVVGTQDGAASRLPIDIVSSMPRSHIAAIVLLSSVQACAAVFAATIVRYVFDGPVELGAGYSWIVAVGMAFVASLALFGLALTRQTLLRKAKTAVQANAFAAAIRRLFESPESYLRRYERTELTLLVGEAKHIAARSVDALGSIASGFVGVVLLGLQLTWYSMPLFVAVVVVGCAFGGATYALSARKRSFDKQAKRIGDRADSMLAQFLDSMEKVRTSGIEHRATHEYFKHYVKRCAAEAGSQSTQYISRALFWFVTQATVLLVCVLAWRMGVSDAGTVLASAIVAVALLSSVRILVLGIGQFSSLRHGSGRVDELLNQGIEEQQGGEEVGSLRGSIEFEDVSFTYEGENRSTLNGVTLRIDAGESVGIVGRSGCGKSTLLALVLGFESPTAGTVRIDGRDVASLDMRSLRRHIGSVLQDDTLIAGSIYENVALTAPDASIAAVKRSLEAVGLWKDVSRMPMGVATIVGEGGCALSGGQVQRILLARALAGSPRILLLDEATSALDGASQETVRHTLAELDCTKVIIAHRIDALADCDRVIVMDEGRIASELRGVSR